ncbi:biotin--[acetyl-CoA-carboxylase] ligase [Mucilaginibacter conchicola]|uniref:Biotin--[acetyl-CoA-carboxylase] ligase n=1 Tax=Mucilaginibacter conchicola TaxID=2303333 RepID=A0A372NTK7_9SPHI|nr:biotin--[acetyl-CoA-carboxylase] ligase [Mucilaginibacter conchicola]RFZ92588.1 biotin--[acetyl-CoA-carboxylase] ligase [Mucilaginibacter conchicola]
MQNNIFSGLFVGQNLVELKQVDSTNTFLKNLLSNSTPVPEGTVIMAEDQFAGRGQRDNTWHAQPGKNLTFSILLNPRFLSAQQQFDLTRAISLGVYDALYPLLRDSLKIKWPNDIYSEGNKFGGMLIENVLQGSQIKHSIIGIGINVNQEDFHPSAINATSIKKILQRDYELKIILADICKHIEAYYLQLKAGKFQEIRELYLNRLYRLNRDCWYKSNGDEFKGVIKNVTNEGLLVVEQSTGEQHYNLKEIEFLKD